LHVLGVIAVIFGGLFGAIWSGAFGAVIGAAVALLLQRSLQQERVIAGLQAALKALQAERVAAAEQVRPDAAASTRPQTAAFEAAEPDVAPMQPTAAALAAPMAMAAPARAALPSAQPRSASTPPPAPRRDPFAPVKAWLFGGNTIVKAGVGILFVGLAFLAKFATEHVQVPVELRLAGIAGVAMVLLFIGWRLRLSRPGYAQVLQGGAVAVLYLTLFVAFRFYGVLAVGPVFALMVAVAALAAALAVLQDARALAAIGALGGFATPILVSTGGGNHVALFSYYLVLDLGIAAVAWYRTWRSLNLIGFLGTFIVATAWGVLKYRPENYASSQTFLVAFFLIFIAIMLMPARQARPDTTPSTDRASSRLDIKDRWVQGTLLFGLPTVSFALQYGLVRNTEYGTALSALLLAGFYVAMATLMRSRPRLAVTFEASLAIGTVFLTLVIPFALDARSTAGAWALEGAGLIWLGLRQSRGLARLFGYALLLLAGLTMMFAFDRHGTPTSVFNAYFFNGLMAAAASLAAALFVKRAGVQADANTTALVRNEAMAEPLLIGWGTLWLLAAAAVQIDTFVPGRLQLAAWLATFSAITLLYTLLSDRLRWPRVGLPPMAHAPLHMLGALLMAAALARPLQDGGWWAWPLALLAHGIGLWRLAPKWPVTARDVVHAFGVLILATLGALQGRAITADWGDATSAWAWLGWLFAPATLLLGLLHPATARRWPVNTAPGAYQWIASLVLAIGLVLWTLLANIASNGSALPLPHVPLANPLDLGVGVALLATWMWTRSEVARAGLARSPALPLAALGGAAFIWLNAILVRGFHHYGGVPFRVDAWMRSLSVQTGITLLWSATALVLMWLSARRAMRLPWMIGAVLLAAVVFKLLLVDLSGSGTVTRIVSFIGVGVLMLVIGYVAPLPGKGKEHAST
jgi:uncharacterized membrane protein